MAGKVISLADVPYYSSPYTAPIVASQSEPTAITSVPSVSTDIESFQSTTSEAADNEAQPEARLEVCSICHEPYRDPHLLSCMHSFCKSCLVQLHTSSSKTNTIKCPLCRHDHVLSDSGVDGLLPNTYLADTCRVEKQQTPLVNRCGQCESLKVVSFCSAPECEDFLCDLCDGAHKRMAMFKSHKLLLPHEAKLMKSKRKCYKCPKHPKECLEVYCSICKNVICRDCALYSHQGHKLKPAEEATAEIKRILRSNCEELKNKLEKFHSHAEEVSKVEKHVTTYPDKMKAFIISQFASLSQQLEDRKQVLLRQVDTQYNDFSKSLWAEKNSLEMSICNLEAGLKIGEQLLSDTNKFEVAVLGTQALASLTKAKSFFWNPEVIKLFGPLVYLPSQNDSSQSLHLNSSRFIQEIGLIKSVCIKLQLQPTGYKQASSSLCSTSTLSKTTGTFEKNGTYCVKAEAVFVPTISCKQLFPKTQISIEVKFTECHAHPPKKIKAQVLAFSNSNAWKIAFKTAQEGEYLVTVKLRLEDEVHCEATASVSLHKIFSDEAEYLLTDNVRDYC